MAQPGSVADVFGAMFLRGFEEDGMLRVVVSLLCPSSLCLSMALLSGRLVPFVVVVASAVACDTELVALFKLGAACIRQGLNHCCERCCVMAAWSLPGPCHSVCLTKTGCMLL